MKEKKKIPWGLIYVGLTVVVMIVFGLVNTEFAGMFSVIANLSLGFVALAVLMTGVFLVTEGGIIHMLLRAQGDTVALVGLQSGVVRLNRTGKAQVSQGVLVGTAHLRGVWQCRQGIE